ncbi:MAG TPA: ABC transporter permease [Ilumatobacter sp.]|nr:ABC transporter permease [Ilumatobacter sp.]
MTADMNITTTVDTAGSPVTYRSHAQPLWRRVLLTREMTVIAMLVFVYLWSRSTIEGFAGELTLYYLLLDVAPILLIALPMTLVIVTGEIDLSVASVVGLSSVVVGLLHQDAGLPIPLAALVAILVGVACGAFNGFLIAYLRLPSLAVTIGTLALFRGLAVGMLGTTAKTEFDSTWTDLATKRIVAGQPFPWILVPFLVLLIGFVLLLHFSPFGRGVYEIGLNDDAARFTGVDVARTKLQLFVIAGAVSAFAGVYYTLRYGSARGDNATGLELQVITAVLLGGVSIFGGRGALHGVVAGVLLIGVLSSALRLEGRTANVINIVIGTLLVLSVISTRVLAWVSRTSQARRRLNHP